MSFPKYLFLLTLSIGFFHSSFIFTDSSNPLEFQETSNKKKQPFSDHAVLFSGNANPLLAANVAHYLGSNLGSATVSKFNDGEIQIQINENVRNKEVFILQSVCPSLTQSINDNLMELFLLVRTIKRASASSITVVIPYYGYARQDRKTAPRVPISAADIALMLESAGVDRVVTVDLHCGQIQGFFQNVPVDNLFAATLFVDYFINKNLENVVIVSPDAGGVGRAKKFMDYMQDKGVDAGMSIISKQRAKAGIVDSMQLIGSVKDADVIIVDDMCDTAGTLVKAAQLLKDEGANRVFAAITHPLFSGKAIEKIKSSVIEELVTTDTIPLKGASSENITFISIAPLLAEAILRINRGESLSELF